MNNKILKQLTLVELASVHLDIHGLPTTLVDGYIESGIGGLVTVIQ